MGKRAKISLIAVVIALLGILTFQNCDGGFSDFKKNKSITNNNEDTFSSGGPEYELTMPNAVQRQSSAAYDSRNKIYLVVTGWHGVKGNFVNTGDYALTSGFMISEGPDYAGAPFAAYSPEDDVFLVAWYRSGAGGGTDTVGRLLRYAGGQVSFLSSTFVIGNKTSRMTEPPHITYVPTRKEFVVVWMAYEAGGGGSIQVRRVSTSGQTIGAQIVAANDGYWNDSPTIAYNPARDEFMVFISAVCSNGNACAKTVKLNSSAQPVGGLQSFRNAGGIWLTNIAYVPSKGIYFASWNEAPNILASFLDVNGNPIGGIIDVAPGYGLAEGTHMAYNRHTDSFMFVFQDTAAYYNLQVEVTSGGGVLGPYTVIERPGNGNYGPNITSSFDKREWLVTTTNDYARTIVRRIPTLQ